MTDRHGPTSLAPAAPFAVAAAVPFLALLVPPDTHEAPQTWAAAALTVLIGVLALFARRLGVPSWMQGSLALLYLPVVALLRDSEGGALSGYGPLLLIPLLWVALYGDRRTLALCIVGIGLVLVLPVWLIGGTGYEEDVETRRTVVWIIASLLVGPTVQELVRRTRSGEQRYRSVFEQVRDVVFQTDSSGRWMLLNPAWTALTGHETASTIGRPIDDFLHPDDRTPTRTALQQLVSASVAEYRAELRIVTIAGEERWVEASFHRIEPEPGSRPDPDHAAAIGGTLTDVTDRHEAERMKEQFFALVSHELRTPLAAIVGYLELLEEEEYERLSEDGRSFVAVMQRNSVRLMRLIADLLFAAQVDAGTMTLLSEPVDLAAVVRESCESIAPRAADAGLELQHQVEFEPVIMGDRERLGQVLDNLLGNALKFTPAGGKIVARLMAAATDGIAPHATIEVVDSGPGISEADQARLFRRFQRARSADEQAVQGVGLGLAITRAIVEGHGGRITVHSSLGEGSCFRVALPLHADPDRD